MSAIAYAGVFTNSTFTVSCGMIYYYWKLIDCLVVNYGFGLHGWDVLLSDFVDGLNVCGPPL